MSAAKLSRRERQILDVLYRQGKASAADVQQALPDAPTYSAVRALLRIMVDKGLVTYEDDGTRYLYAPIQPRRNAAIAALRQVVQTFFDGSAGQAAATLLSTSETDLSDEELRRLARLIEAAQDEAHNKEQSRTQTPQSSAEESPVCDSRTPASEKGKESS